MSVSDRVCTEQDDDEFTCTTNDMGHSSEAEETACSYVNRYVTHYLKRDYTKYGCKPFIINRQTLSVNCKFSS